MPPGVVLPLGAFMALAALFAIVLRRAGRLLAETREAAGFRRAVVDLARRIDISLGQATERIDAVRRGREGPETLAPILAAAIEAVERYAEEATALRRPNEFVDLQEAFVGELERAGRALEMIRHGAAIQASARAGSRNVEAQTAVKRGYLNVLHAREAIARQATDVVESRTLEEQRWLSRRRNAVDRLRGG